MHCLKASALYSIKLNDGYKDDLKVLACLYGPLMGLEAMSLYISLRSQAKLCKNVSELSKLLKLCGVSLDKLNKLLSVLEEFDLLEIKQNKKETDKYLFKVKAVRDAASFLRSLTMSKKLKDFDYNYYASLKEYFMSSVIDEDEYEEIMDFDTFISSLKTKYCPLENVLDEQATNEIKRVYNLYNVSFNDLEFAIIKSIENNKNGSSLNLVKFNKSIEEGHKTSLGSIVDTFDSLLPLESCKQFLHRPLLPNEVEAIETLKEKYNIPNGVFNVIISYYFKNKHQERINKVYFEKVIESLILNNAFTTKKALDYFKAINKATKEVKTVSEEKSEIKSNEDKSSKMIDDIVNLLGD